MTAEPVFVDLLRSPGIDSQPGGIDPRNRFLGYINVYGYGLGTQTLLSLAINFSWPMAISLEDIFEPIFCSKT